MADALAEPTIATRDDGDRSFEIHVFSPVSILARTLEPVPTGGNRFFK
jgi:hypothetical protein